MKSLKKGLLKKVGHTDGASVQSSITEDAEVFYDAPEAVLHDDAHDEGGLGFTNKELLASQRSAIMEVGKELGRKVLTGSFSLINLSVPVKMFEPRSYLQKLADVWVYPGLLEKAVAAKSPEERLQWTVTWFTAGLQHVFQSWKKPFNPLLGETWQAHQPQGGCTIFMEQISHHPPISAFEMFGPKRAYVFSGHSQPDVQFKANTIRTTAKGYRCIEFTDDGTKIDIQYPAYNMRGIVYGDMPRGDMSGVTRFTDHTHGLCCEVHFGKVEGADSELLRRPDSITGSIFRLAPGATGSTSSSKGLKTSSIGGLFGGSRGSGDAARGFPDQAISSCIGNWLSHLDWDGERRWTLAEQQPEPWLPVDDPLPSDCRFRLDLATVKDGDLPGAQAAKEALENRQRQDVKTRKEAGVLC